ncbi:MAG TPA: hypothetical protein PLB63_02020 [Planctomycetota bacterium]|nr:hypothetical protein [Planctomycetota bacterium]HQA99788.1 hypothetical protein [Planctomycetota bacterium]
MLWGGCSGEVALGKFALGVICSGGNLLWGGSKITVNIYNLRIF